MTRRTRVRIEIAALYALVFGGVIVGACATLPRAGVPKTPEEAEREAYQFALEANDTASIAVDMGKAILHVAVEVDRAKRALKCGGAGDERAHCESEALDAALLAGEPVGRQLDAAARVQTELRRALVYYAECAPGPDDVPCRASRLDAVREKAKPVKAAALAAREAAQTYVRTTR